MPGRGSNIALAVLAAFILAAGITVLCFFLRQNPDSIGTTGVSVADRSDGNEPDVGIPDPADPGEKKAPDQGVNSILVTLDTGGAPMPGSAFIEMRYASGEPVSANPEIPATGRFRLASATGLTSIRVSAPGFTDAVAAVAADQNEVQVRLESNPCTVSVRISDRLGKLVETGSLKMVESATGITTLLETGPSGLRTGSVPCGDWAFVFVPAAGKEDKIGKRVTLLPGDSVSLDLSLSAASSKLRLLDQGGNPWRNGRLRIHRISGKEGTVTVFDGVPASNEVELAAFSREDAWLVLEAEGMAWERVRVEYRTEPLSVTLRPAASVVIQIDPGSARMPVEGTVIIRYGRGAEAAIPIPVRVSESGGISMALDGSPCDVHLTIPGFETIDVRIADNDYMNGVARVHLRETSRKQ